MPDFSKAEVSDESTDLTTYRAFLERLTVGQTVSLPLEAGESSRKVMRHLNTAAKQSHIRLARLPAENGAVRFRVLPPEKRAVRLTDEAKRARVREGAGHPRSSPSPSSSNSRRWGCLLRANHRARRPISRCKSRASSGLRAGADVPDVPEQPEAPQPDRLETAYDRLGGHRLPQAGDQLPAGAASGGVPEVIASLEGTVAAVNPGAVVLEVGGLGLRLLVPASTAARLSPVGERTKLLTHLLVREDARTLYGFGTAAELDLFERLLTARGLGPAKALPLLSGSSVEALRAAIAGENTGALLRIPGIGRRLAAQIVLDLKDKLGPVTAEAGADGEVLAWLTAMGFPAAEAQAAVAKLPRDPAPPMEERVRQALTILRPE